MPDLTQLPIDRIRFEDVVAFCERQITEHLRLDYKAKFSGSDATKQIAKTIAAFANTQGGTLLLGVGESENRKPERKPQGNDLGNEPKSQIQSVAGQAVFPPVVPEISEFLPNPADKSRGFVIVRVPASDAIHTIDGGRGIYVRINDQSEPVPATLENIEWMQQRRASANAMQRARRTKQFEILRAAAGAQSNPGDIEISIGPRHGVDPLLDVRTLRDSEKELSVRSANAYGTLPTDPRFDVLAMPDGIFSAFNKRNGFGDFAGSFDVYGNVGLICRLRIDATSQQLWMSETDGLPSHGERYPGVIAQQAIERVLCVVRAARNLYAATGYVGLVDLAFRAPNAAGYPLFVEHDREFKVVGRCAPNAEVTLETVHSSTELGGDLTVVLEPFVHRIVWAWGCMDDEAPKGLLDLAEQMHYGNDKCPCCNLMKPKMRTSCRKCRENVVTQEA